jgi:hypothetical protein
MARRIRERISTWRWAWQDFGGMRHSPAVFAGSAPDREPTHTDAICDRAPHGPAQSGNLQELPMGVALTEV